MAKRVPIRFDNGDTVRLTVDEEENPNELILEFVEEDEETQHALIDLVETHFKSQQIDVTCDDGYLAQSGEVFFTSHGGMSEIDAGGSRMFTLVEQLFNQLDDKLRKSGYPLRETAEEMMAEQASMADFYDEEDDFPDEVLNGVEVDTVPKDHMKSSSFTATKRRLEDVVFKAVITQKAGRFLDAKDIADLAKELFVRFPEQPPQELLHQFLMENLRPKVKVEKPEGLEITLDMLSETLTGAIVAAYNSRFGPERP